MNIEFCNVHGDYYAAVEIQDDWTGNYKTHFRKVPDLNRNDERIIRVEGRKINVKPQFDDYLFNKRMLEDGIREYKKWKRDYRQ